MRIALYSRVDNPSLSQLATLLNGFSLEYTLNPLSTDGCDCAVSLGGDGTFLSSVRKMGHGCIPIIGINSGRLGFLSTVSKESAAKALWDIVEGRYELDNRSMIKLIADNIPEGIPHRALNEFTIQKSGTAMVCINVTIDDYRVGSYWADGIIVSTPTGSTAYSMSVGGAILTPGCRNFIISPIAPHNLNIRPLVVPDSSVIKLGVETRQSANAIATIDNREYSVSNGASFELRRSKYELPMIRLHDSNFYNTIHEKLLWAIDLRK